PEVSKPELIFGSSAKMIEYFGTDKDLDRILEVATSDEVTDYLVSKFGLYHHYDVDSASSEGLFWVRENFRSHYAVQKNKNDAIELSIEDTDPQLAADMANAAREKINEISQRLVKNTQARFLASFEENIKVKQKELDKLADSVRVLQNKYGIYSVTQQGEVFASELALAQGEVMRNRGRLEVLSDNPLIPKDTVEYIRANLRAGERTLQRLYKSGNYGDNFSVSNYNEGLPQVALVNDLHYQARRQLSYDIERYHQIRSAYNTDIPAIQLISVAERPIMKIRPKRTALVVASTVAVFLFTLLAALLADAYRDVNWKKLAADSEN
ncbi:MAG: hypothetical protein ACKOCO_12525, partial [Bacteroidota bacterium]